MQPHTVPECCRLLDQQLHQQEHISLQVLEQVQESLSLLQTLYRSNLPLTTAGTEPEQPSAQVHDVMLLSHFHETGRTTNNYQDMPLQASFHKQQQSAYQIRRDYRGEEAQTVHHGQHDKTSRAFSQTDACQLPPHLKPVSKEAKTSQGPRQVVVGDAPHEQTLHPQTEKGAVGERKQRLSALETLPQQDAIYAHNDAAVSSPQTTENREVAALASKGSLHNATELPLLSSHQTAAEASLSTPVANRALQFDALRNATSQPLFPSHPAGRKDTLHKATQLPGISMLHIAAAAPLDAALAGAALQRGAPARSRCKLSSEAFAASPNLVESILSPVKSRDDFPLKFSAKAKNLASCRHVKSTASPSQLNGSIAIRCAEESLSPRPKIAGSRRSTATCRHRQQGGGDTPPTTTLLTCATSTETFCGGRRGQTTVTVSGPKTAQAVHISQGKTLCEDSHCSRCKAHTKDVWVKSLRRVDNVTNKTSKFACAESFHIKAEVVGSPREDTEPVPINQGKSSPGGPPPAAAGDGSFLKPPLSPAQSSARTRLTTEKDTCLPSNRHGDVAGKAAKPLSHPESSVVNGGFGSENKTAHALSVDCIAGVRRAADMQVYFPAQNEPADPITSANCEQYRSRDKRSCAENFCHNVAMDSLYPYALLPEYTTRADSDGSYECFSDQLYQTHQDQQKESKRRSKLECDKRDYGIVGEPAAPGRRILQKQDRECGTCEVQQCDDTQQHGISTGFSQDFFQSSQKFEPAPLRQLLQESTFNRAKHRVHHVFPFELVHAGLPHYPYSDYALVAPAIAVAVADNKHGVLLGCSATTDSHCSASCCRRRAAQVCTTTERSSPHTPTSSSSSCVSPPTSGRTASSKCNCRGVEADNILSDAKQLVSFASRPKSGSARASASVVHNGTAWPRSRRFSCFVGNMYGKRNALIFPVSYDNTIFSHGSASPLPHPPALKPEGIITSLVTHCSPTSSAQLNAVSAAHPATKEAGATSCSSATSLHSQVEHRFCSNSSMRKFDHASFCSLCRQPVPRGASPESDAGPLYLWQVQGSSRRDAAPAWVCKRSQPSDATGDCSSGSGIQQERSNVLDAKEGQLLCGVAARTQDQKERSPSAVAESDSDCGKYDQLHAFPCAAGYSKSVDIPAESEVSVERTTQRISDSESKLVQQRSTEFTPNGSRQTEALYDFLRPCRHRWQPLPSHAGSADGHQAAPSPTTLALNAYSAVCPAPGFRLEKALHSKARPFRSSGFEFNVGAVPPVAQRLHIAQTGQQVVSGQQHVLQTGDLLRSTRSRQPYATVDQRPLHPAPQQQYHKLKQKELEGLQHKFHQHDNSKAATRFRLRSLKEDAGDNAHRHSSLQRKQKHKPPALRTLSCGSDLQWVSDSQQTPAVWAKKAPVAGVAASPCMTDAKTEERTADQMPQHASISHMSTATTHAGHSSPTEMSPSPAVRMNEENTFLLPPQRDAARRQLLDEPSASDVHCSSLLGSRLRRRQEMMTGRCHDSAHKLSEPSDTPQEDDGPTHRWCTPVQLQFLLPPSAYARLPSQHGRAAAAFDSDTMNIVGQPEMAEIARNTVQKEAKTEGKQMYPFNQHQSSIWRSVQNQIQRMRTERRDAQPDAQICLDTPRAPVVRKRACCRERAAELRSWQQVALRQEGATSPREDAGEPRARALASPFMLKLTAADAIALLNEQ